MDQTAGAARGYGQGRRHGSVQRTDLTDAVIERLAECDDPRFKTIMTSLICHLHDFVRDVELTEAEWMTAIRFLTELGQACTDKRQEFILLSDTLGVSILVDAINHRMPTGAVELTVLGPVYSKARPSCRSGRTSATAPRASRPSSPGVS